MTVGRGRFAKAINRRFRAFFAAFWNAIPGHHPTPLKRIDHQVIVYSSSEFSIPSEYVDPRTYVDWSSYPYPPL